MPQLEGGVGGPTNSNSIVDPMHEEIPITFQFERNCYSHHLSAKQLCALTQTPAMSLARISGVDFRPGGLNQNSTPVGVIVDQGLSNGVPRQMAPKTSRRFYITQRGDADVDTAPEDRTAVVGVSHVMPVGIDNTTTSHDFQPNVYTGEGAPPFELADHDFTSDEGAALLKKSCVWADHHGQSVEEVLSGCVEATKGAHTRLAVPLNQPTAISKLVTSKLELGAKKLTQLFPTSKVHPDKIVKIKNANVHPTDMVDHVVLTKQDAEQAASKLVENLKPAPFHGGMNVSIHPLDGPLSEPVTVNMVIRRKPVTIPGHSGPLHMSHDVVSKAIGGTAGAATIMANSTDGAINAIFAQDCADGADVEATGGSLVSTSAPVENAAAEEEDDAE